MLTPLLAAFVAIAPVERCSWCWKSLPKLPGVGTEPERGAATAEDVDVASPPWEWLPTKVEVELHLPPDAEVSATLEGTSVVVRSQSRGGKVLASRLLLPFDVEDPAANIKIVHDEAGQGTVRVSLPRPTGLERPAPAADRKSSGLVQQHVLDHAPQLSSISSNTSNQGDGMQTEGGDLSLPSTLPARRAPGERGEVVDARNLSVTGNAAADLVLDAGTTNATGGVPCGTFLIISMERSGTTTLCNALNADTRAAPGTPGSWRGACKYELLNFAPMNYGEKFLERHALSKEWAAQHPRKVVALARREAEARGTCVWGFKLFPHHAANVSAIVDLVDQCVVYRRANTTAQYLSWRTATQSGCWATNRDKQRRDPHCAKREKVDTLGDDWEAFRAGADAWYARGVEACASAGKPTRLFEMERYLAQTHQWIAEDSLDAAARAGAAAASNRAGKKKRAMAAKAGRRRVRATGRRRHVSSARR